MRWVGYLPADNTWEPIDTFTSAAMEEVISYNLRNPVVPMTKGRPSEQTEQAPAPSVSPAKVLSESELRTQRREQRAADRDVRNAPSAAPSSASAAGPQGGERPRRTVAQPASYRE